MYVPKGGTYEVTCRWLQNILAMSFIFTNLPFGVGAPRLVLIFDKGSCLLCGNRCLYYWLLEGLVKFSHVFKDPIIQEITTIDGFIHGWGTTFGCLTVSRFFLITSHTWYNWICIVEHILDHTYISSSILSTTTKLI
jgi:hypothetical protein